MPSNVVDRARSTLTRFLHWLFPGKKLLERYEQEVKTLGASLTKVYQNSREELRVCREENAQLLKTIADQEETIGNLRAVVTFLRSRMPFGG